MPFEDHGPGSSVFLSSNAATIESMTTVDSLIDSGVCDPPQLIKLDVQGFEIEVLEGFVNHFSSCQVIQCELSLLPLIPQAPLMDEVIFYLGGRGFLMLDVEEIIVPLQLRLAIDALTS
jgi:hypothetical protein